MKIERFEKHIDISEQDKNAVDILIETGLSKQKIKEVMQKGAVWLSRKDATFRIRRAKKKLQVNDTLHMYYDDEVLSKIIEAPVLIADENKYSIWCKPYGMYSQGSKWGDHCTIHRWVEKNLEPQRSAFIVHRLDRAARGLMVIAHEKKIAAYFCALFSEREVKKIYHAVVQGQFPGHTDINTDIDGKPALSHVDVLAFDDANNQSLVEVSIETGRKHQIRIHLSEMGFPIVGDRMHGDSNYKDEINLSLTSNYLSFVCPVNGVQKTFELSAEQAQKFPVILSS